MRNTFVLIAFALAGLSTHKLLDKTEAKATGPTKQFTKDLRRDRYLQVLVQHIHQVCP